MPEKANIPAKNELPVLITPQLMQLKITSELAVQKITIAEALNAESKIVLNEDHLPAMKSLLETLEKIDDAAAAVHKKVKEPYWDAGKACDTGKNLVLAQTSSIRGRIKPVYDRLLKNVADRKRKADVKALQDEQIKKIIETNLMEFSNGIVAAVSVKQILEVEARVNLEKSPSMAKKYGEFHGFAIERYDSVLAPILKDKKEALKKLRGLNVELQTAEDSNDPDKMDEIDSRINELSDGILQKNAEIGEAVLTGVPMITTVAQEVFPATKVVRTKFTMELVDVEVAIKKARTLLDISINKEAAKVVLQKLKDDGVFNGTDDIEHVVDGIKYIATREREIL